MNLRRSPAHRKSFAGAGERAYIGVMSDLQPVVDLVDFSAVEPIAETLWPGRRRDYVAPGLTDPGLMRLFPDLAEGEVADLQWPYLRKDAPHIWRRDLRGRRNPYIGVLSLDEATLLHNNALPFRGKRGLEIGCHYAWSTAHLVAAGLDLDVIDPALGTADQMRDVRASLASVGPARLWAGFSPNIVPAVRAVRPELWSFAFIDGYHEGEAPREDARAVIDLMADGRHGDVPRSRFAARRGGLGRVRGRRLERRAIQHDAGHGRGLARRGQTGRACGGPGYASGGGRVSHPFFGAVAPIALAPTKPSTFELKSAGAGRQRHIEVRRLPPLAHFLPRCPPPWPGRWPPPWPGRCPPPP